MMKRMLMLLGVICLAFPVGVLAQGAPGSGGQPGSGPGAGPPSGRGATASRQVLFKKIASVEWEDVALEDVFEWLKEQGPVNVIVRWGALADEGIDPGTPVTLSLRDTTVAKILTEVFEQISEVEPVLFRGIGNTIKISTRFDFNRKLYVRVYDISDILLRTPDFDNGPNVDLTRSQSGGGGGGGAGDESIWSDDDDDDDDDERDLDQRIQTLIELIENTVEPETWLSHGGRGTIVSYNKMLVIRNSIEVHEKIGGPFVLD
jgi:hypothetical protein